MTANSEHDRHIAQMSFGSVYAHYVSKVKKKGRTKAELHQIFHWLTGFDDAKLKELIAQKVTFVEFITQPLAKALGKSVYS